MSKKLAMTLGVIFLIVGILGFIPNPIVGTDALFHADTWHNIVHIVTGLVLMYVSAKTAVSSGTMKIVGVVYLLVAILGLLAVDAGGMGTILGFIQVNSADNWLHVVLGIVIVIAGFAKNESSSPMAGM